MSLPILVIALPGAIIVFALLVGAVVLREMFCHDPAKKTQANLETAELVELPPHRRSHRQVNHSNLKEKCDSTLEA